MPSFSRCFAGKLSANLAKLPSDDTLVNVWVVFADKPSSGVSQALLTGRTKARRSLAGYTDVSGQDLPISSAYISAVIQEGAALRHTFKWGNAASFTVTASSLNRIASMPFVSQVIPVAAHIPVNRDIDGKLFKTAGDPLLYGPSLAQLSLIGVPQLHKYMADKGLFPGDGIVVGVFDDGFWLGHRCLKHVTDNNAVIADSDFVTNSDDPYISFTDHGTQTMSLVGGYDESRYIGVAWAAKFIVARTEESIEERHVEEDNWAAAIVWAESIGVDIVTSSLGYREDYTYPDTDYSYEDMDGVSTIVAKAAKWATERGVIVVNAMGNESSHTREQYQLYTLSSPADVRDVISVGAVSYSGRICSFSGTGPASDGRIKPDLVAMGCSVVIPSEDTYSSGGNGTSFSTPMVAGIAACIKQLYPLAGADEIRQRLYGSCTLAPGQNAVDNIFGRGIPDALLACIGSSEVYFKCEDTSGLAVTQASFYYGNNLIGVSNEYGVFTVDFSSRTLPETLTVSHENFPKTAVVIDSVGIRRRVGFGNMLYIKITDNSAKAVTSANVYVKNQFQQHFTGYPTGSDGVTAVPWSESDILTVNASATGYMRKPDTLFSYNPHTDSLIIILDKIPAIRFNVYPNVFSLLDISDNKTIAIEFIASDEENTTGGKQCELVVRSVDGNLLWRYNANLLDGQEIRADNGETLAWNCRGKNGKPVSLGVYLVVVRYGGKSYKKKILITG